MKYKISAIILVLSTLIFCLCYPLAIGLTKSDISNGNPSDSNINLAANAAVEIVFVLDTTSSMGEFLHIARNKIWAIAATIASAEPNSVVRIGIVAYRDRGEEYVTRMIPLSADLDSIYMQLLELDAAGGGDAPEHVIAGLNQAVNNMAWSPDPRTYRAVYLVGDAQPHFDYERESDYASILAKAVQKDIFVNSIQCGNDSDTTTTWRQIAHLGNGRYFVLDQHTASIITTPFDSRMAYLSEELDKFSLINERNSLKKLHKKQSMQQLHSAITPVAAAQRGLFNIANVKNRRSKIAAEIAELGQKRHLFIQNTLSQDDTLNTSFDTEFYKTLKSQVESKGIELKNSLPIF